MIKLKRILAVSALFFTVGVLFHTLKTAVILYAAALLFIVLISLKKGAASALIVAAALLAGFFHTNLVFERNLKLSEPYENKSAFSCRVDSLPQKSIYGNSVTVRSGDVKIFLTYSGVRLSYGDVIYVRAIPKLTDKSYHLQKGAYLTAYSDDITVLYNKVNYFNPRDLAHLLRGKLLEKTDEIFGGEVLMLARSVLLGSSDYSSTEFSQKLSMGSISHVIAISGLHVSLVSGAVLFIVRRISSRRYMTLICIPFTFFFILLTGASPSAVRAAIMFSLFVISEEICAYYDGYTSLAIAAYVIWARNPFYAYSLSFILSFSAVIGILMFASPIAKRLSVLPTAVRDSLSVTLAAQSFTLPVTAVNFLRFPVTALIANLFAVPLIPLVMISGYAAVILSFFGLHLPFKIIAEILIGFIIKTAEIAAALPLSNISVSEGNTVLFLIFYIPVLSSLYLNLKTRFKKTALLCFFLALAVLIVAAIFRLKLPYTVI